MRRAHREREVIAQQPAALLQAPVESRLGS
jgi:hypothetical protein